MNNIEKVRSEIRQYFDPASEIGGSDDTITSPSGNYIIKLKSFKQTKPDCNWEVTKIEVFKSLPSELLFSFFVNDSTFFHSFIVKENIEYLICAEDLCGGQTIIDLTNKKMSSYSENNDGFIWTHHLLSPDENLMAVFGCGWGSPFFVIIYHFDDPMTLPLKVASQPSWAGYDMIEWIDNKSLRVKKSEDEEEVLLIG